MLDKAINIKMLFYKLSYCSISCLVSPAGASWLNVACIIYIVYIAQTFDVLLFSQGSLSFNSLGLKII